MLPINFAKNFIVVIPVYRQTSFSGFLQSMYFMVVDFVAHDVITVFGKKFKWRGGICYDVVVHGCVRDTVFTDNFG
jgi:hypothetical protein